MIKFIVDENQSIIGVWFCIELYIMVEFMFRKYFEEGIGKFIDEENVVDVVYLLKGDGDVLGKNFLVCVFVYFFCICCVFWLIEFSLVYNSVCSVECQGEVFELVSVIVYIDNEF